MVAHYNYSLNLRRTWENKGTLHKATSYTLRRCKKLNRRSSQTVSETKFWILQTSDQLFCVTSVTRKSTMEWQGLEHVLECLILNFDKAVKTFTWTSMRPCAWQSSTKLRVKRFHSWWLAGPIDSKWHTLIKLIGLLLGKAVKIKGIHTMIILFE